MSAPATGEDSTAPPPLLESMVFRCTFDAWTPHVSLAIYWPLFYTHADQSKTWTRAEAKICLLKDVFLSYKIVELTNCHVRQRRRKMRLRLFLGSAPVVEHPTFYEGAPINRDSCINMPYKPGQDVPSLIAKLTKARFIDVCIGIDTMTPSQLMALREALVHKKTPCALPEAVARQMQTQPGPAPPAFNKAGKMAVAEAQNIDAETQTVATASLRPHGDGYNQRLERRIRKLERRNRRQHRAAEKSRPSTLDSVVGTSMAILNMGLGLFNVYQGLRNSK